MTDTNPAFSALVFEIADTFDMEITRDHSTELESLKGDTKFKLPLMAGLNWTITPKIKDSATYAADNRVGVVVHVCGSLYLCLLVTGAGSSSSSRLWVLDGSKLGWVASPPQPFPLAAPTEAELARILSKGVVACFWRSLGSTAWVPYPPIGSSTAIVIKTDAFVEATSE